MDDTLRARQIRSLERMLHLNKDGPTDLTQAVGSDQIVWKALVLDARSQAVVSSVLRVNDLLRCGVTIHSLITARRSALSDVPAIYFVEPTRANVDAVVADLQADRYQEFYVNFTSSIDRQLLEDFAKQVLLTGKSSAIKQIYDQYLDYVVTEPDLFSLDAANVYTTFNHPHTTEDQIHALADTIARGLLSVVLTTGNVPIIRCQRNGPAELVATVLDLKLRDYVANTKNLALPAVQQRSVLILVDRNIDLLSMFSHSWIYQCMISDVFSLKRNTIAIPGSSHQYDIDPRDFFWSANALLPFPDVVENANLELERYKKDAHDLTARTGITSLQDIDPDHNDTTNIQQAVDALPELTARKATLDMHMDVLASLLKELESKALDKFFEIEQNLSNPQVQHEFLDLLAESSAKKDNVSDKLRTFMVLYLLVDNLSDGFVAEVKQKFQDLDPSIDLSALKYIDKFKHMTKVTNLSSLTQVDSSAGARDELHVSGSNNSALFNNLSSRLYGLTEGRLTEGLSSLTSGLKKLLPTKKNLAITNIVETIMDPSGSSGNGNSIQLTDDYLYLDPKSRGGHSKPPKRQSYNEAIVFVVGGGNYLEYQNLQEYAHSPHNSVQHVVYGSTNLVTADEFLRECQELGRARE